MTDITAETLFTEQDAAAMKVALADTGRFDYTLHIEVKDAAGKIVAEAKGDYVVKDFSNLLG